ncbi:MAG: YebC/PmpR family DNA-binding transcriptional regulator [Limnochordia bacterium]|nr:YebC/PmpR family DNA-binding transcriptional regulator [Limnochordia bacterium]MDD2630340.1 YebC/PmpR family DNA-binding transcriptional regulator [Limnochordia bacterium]MDD4517906.1 YebC/PmpR family DNA-binding transcriptional regulator [Limnochordia bacterium]
MAGHSKWANIKHKKQKEDKIRGRVFGKLTREIIVAAKHGGGDIDSNFRLRVAVDRARQANMPMDNIERAIKRGTGELEGANYEEFSYEGYGPAGVAILMSIATDNRNRTASDLRHILDKHGGNLGETGCVSWMFTQKGELALDVAGIDEDELMLQAIEAGAEDVEVDEEEVCIYTEPGELQKVQEILEGLGYTFSRAENTMVPSTYVQLSRQDAERVLKLMDVLEDHDDVQEVFANFDIPEEIMEEISLS